ncbi:hypothetical protein F0562_015819 [Nyssa sinensis]|uniref:DNA-3-methyladenine glycosylase II n=1 Tax=Nyssa sinensis TaxID=561372 RepID=A0A5J4ZL17_9ASTE|nr:hypothetical protein F0562_015819 [Nyssa sinensis]
MLNVVADKEGVGAAVLIRSCAPVSGLKTIQQRRGLITEKPVLLTGPGKVGQALGISTEWSNHPLFTPGGLELLDGPKPEKILIGPRIGIEYASPEHVSALWRFAVADELPNYIGDDVDEYSCNIDKYHHSTWYDNGCYYYGQTHEWDDNEEYEDDNEEYEDPTWDELPNYVSDDADEYGYYGQTHECDDNGEYEDPIWDELPNHVSDDADEYGLNSNSWEEDDEQCYDQTHKSFDQDYSCFPVSRINKSHLEAGNRIIMPHSALEDLTSIEVEYPMLFEIKSTSSARGDTIMIIHEDNQYYIDIVETKPSNAICLIETDCEVEFAPPLDYKEPAEKKPKTVFNWVTEPATGRDQEPKFKPFTGVSRRLDGAETATTSMVKENGFAADTRKLIFGAMKKSTKITEEDVKEESMKKEEKKFQPFTGKKYTLGN